MDGCGHGVVDALRVAAKEDAREDPSSGRLREGAGGVAFPQERRRDPRGHEAKLRECSEDSARARHLQERVSFWAVDGFHQQHQARRASQPGPAPVPRRVEPTSPRRDASARTACGTLPRVEDGVAMERCDGPPSAQLHRAERAQHRDSVHGRQGAQQRPVSPRSACPRSSRGVHELGCRRDQDVDRGEREDAEAAELLRPLFRGADRQAGEGRHADLVRGPQDSAAADGEAVGRHQELHEVVARRDGRQRWPGVGALREERRDRARARPGGSPRGSDDAGGGHGGPRTQGVAGSPAAAREAHVGLPDRPLPQRSGGGEHRAGEAQQHGHRHAADVAATTDNHHGGAEEADPEWSARVADKARQQHRTATTRRRGPCLSVPSTTLAKLEEDFEWPLHVVQVDKISIHNVLDMMADQTRQRWSYLLSLLRHDPAAEIPVNEEDQIAREADDSHDARQTSTTPHPDIPQRVVDEVLERQGAQRGQPEPLLTADDVKRLRECGIIIGIDKEDVKHTVIPFTVVEEKAKGKRRRFIAWPKEGNQWSRETCGYVPDVPLKHVSEYLPTVREEYACTDDLRTSFFQVPLETTARPHFAFQYGGRWWTFTRLPMGHVASPEIMTIVTSTLARLPGYAKPEHARKVPASIVTTVWIDNIRYTGPRHDVEAMQKLLQHTARHINATMNEDDHTLGTEYDFIGVHWNHATKTVCVAAKTLGKLQHFHDGITYAQLEKLFSQLCFAASVLDIWLYRFYWVLKIIRRRLSLLGRDPRRLLDRPARLPPNAAARLAEWVHRAKANTPRSVLAEAAVAREAHSAMQKESTLERRTLQWCAWTVFTDASSYGWGAILIDTRTQRIESTGAKWDESESQLHINALEALGVKNALCAFATRIEDDAHIRIRIDNTTVISNLVKKTAPNKATAQALQDAHDLVRKRGWTLHASYVKSAENLADEPSRQWNPK